MNVMSTCENSINVFLRTTWFPVAYPNKPCSAQFWPLESKTAHIHYEWDGYWNVDKILIKKYSSNSSRICLGRRCNRRLLSTINWLILFGILQKVNYCTHLQEWQKRFTKYQLISPLSTTINVISNILPSALKQYINKITEYH